MQDKLYIVYKMKDEYIDPNWSKYAYEVTDSYFTSKEQAELCADYLNMICPDTFNVQEVKNGDSFDFESLIEEQERRYEAKRIAREKNSRRSEIQSYALYTSRIEGKNYGELLKEYSDKYADYIENGR